MDELLSKREKLQTELTLVFEKVERLTEKQNKLAGSVETMMNKVTELIVFNSHLEIVRKEIDDEKNSMFSEKANLDCGQGILENQLKEINSVVFEFEKYDPKHLFLDSSISNSVLSSEEEMDFTYQRKKKVQEMIKNLEPSMNPDVWKKKRSKMQKRNTFIFTVMKYWTPECVRWPYKRLRINKHTKTY